MHAVAAMLAAEHFNDLLREAESERRARLVRGARRSAWSLFLGRLADRLRRLAGSWRRGAGPAPTTGPRPATA